MSAEKNPKNTPAMGGQVVTPPFSRGCVFAVGGGHFPKAFPRHAKVYDQWRPASDDQKN